MKTDEIRRKFLKFFEEKNHNIVDSESLIPQNDPTLIFTSAGMVQFKDFFSAKSTKNLPYTRAASCQKCLRAGGKDSDLENVGRTPRHHTFFEMLGNFSFGDYFKKEAIRWAWEFIVDILDLDKNLIWASVYHEDEEAYKIWQNYLPEERIVKLGKKDNYWGPPGDTGPCGPCSELYYDMGEEFSCEKDDCKPGCECDRFLEIWNLVFTQYDMNKNEELKPLSKKNIDTGMGLERIASVMQGVTNNFYIDIFKPLIKKCEKILGVEYNKKNEEHFHIIADHVRALTFALTDGVIPSNEGRGYVIRRILRRALRQAKILDYDKPFLYKLAQVVVKQFEETYPELKDAQQHVQNIIKMEEENFLKTLDKGLEILNNEIKKLKKNGDEIIDGDITFKLYDTYGFPFELTKEISEEKDLKVDENGFKNRMEEQRKRGKESWKGNQKEEDFSFIVDEGIEKTDFLGYEKLEAESKLIYMKDSDSGYQLIFEKTPFYAESGGQVGDTGKITGDNLLFEVTDTKKVNDVFIHIGNLKDGELKKGKSYSLIVDKKRRKAIARNHTATHILHRVLKEVLGEHVNQAGSMVAENRLRFDFTHMSKLSSEEIIDIEKRINRAAMKNYKLKTEIKSLKEAKEEDVVALFSEKYKDEVRVVSIDNFTKELCGGTHLDYTGEIGFFKIVDESALASGVRRIEAVTGESAYEYIQREDHLLKEIQNLIKADSKDIVDKINFLKKERKELKKKVEKLKLKKATSNVDEIIKNKSNINGINIIKTSLEVSDNNILREMAQEIKDNVKENSIILLMGNKKNKVSGVIMVTEDLTDKYNAGKISGKIASKINGGGGGRPDMAQFGGSDPSGIENALEFLDEIIKRND